MASRAQVLIPVIIAAAIVGIVGIITIPSDHKLQSVDFPKGTIKVDNIVLDVEVADTDSTRARGLMFKEQLSYNQGMIFVFEEEQIASMWMLNMQFPLDVIWFDEDGNVVHIEKNAEPCKSALETMACTFKNGNDEKSKYVLEVTAGFVDKFNITEKSKLEIISI
ncbi:MAG TPA: DUF192 domain-containing protein [Nitrosopumilaceae archaeon]|nr:DUF192 domain-containing protein [Nitrosopumilaceae archaeon]